MPCLALHKVGQKVTFPILLAIYQYLSAPAQEVPNPEQACKVLAYCLSRTQTKTQGIVTVSVVKKPQTGIASLVLYLDSGWGAKETAQSISTVPVPVPVPG